MSNLMASHEWKGLTPTAKRKYMTAIAVSEDGEIIENAEVIPKRKPRTPAQIEAAAERAASETALADHSDTNGGFFTALFKRKQLVSDRFPQLNTTDFARLLYLATFLKFNDNTLKHRNGRPLDKCGLTKLLGMSDRRFREFIRRVQDADIIIERDAEYAFKPSVFYRGRMSEIPFDVSTLDHTRIYRNTVRYLYEKYNNGRQLANVGLIYSILPFISYGTNVVSHNPNARDFEDVQPIELGELAQKLGYSTKQRLKQALEKVKLDGAPVFLIVNNPNKRNEHRVIVNTNVVFAGDSKALASIKAMNVIFNQ